MKFSVAAPVAACHGLLFRGVDGFTRKDGQIFPISGFHAAFRGGEFVGTVAAFQDITTRKQDEEFLLSTSSTALGADREHAVRRGGRG